MLLSILPYQLLCLGHSHHYDRGQIVLQDHHKQGGLHFYHFAPAPVSSNFNAIALPMIFSSALVFIVAKSGVSIARVSVSQDRAPPVLLA